MVVAESIGTRLVEQKRIDIRPIYELIRQRFHNPVPRRPSPPRPSLDLRQLTARLNLSDDQYARYIKACIGLDIIALVGIGVIIGVAIIVDLVAYSLIGLLGFVGGIIAIVALIGCAVGLVAFYFATTSREERKELEF